MNTIDDSLGTPITTPEQKKSSSNYATFVPIAITFIGLPIATLAAVPPIEYVFRALGEATQIESYTAPANYNSENQ